ncbi:MULTISPECIES: arsenate reductase ArsC [unclassified Proteiniphilum]|jgi:arsenate reductase|uniref:arsenate reductase ArsC n=1 Tax=unclassified Proteiniphilum TaxID=2622718 RepID=UPI0025806117|nr:MULTISPECIES: arsenate reductase ArsC [unclassified Proteiniphilum]
MKILILCTGNSCRSQMAHAFLESFNADMEVRSAGTHPAAEVHPLAIKVMNETGLDISNHRPTQVDTYINEAWDYVITVCGDANENCPIFTGKVKTRLHIGFEDPAKVTGSDAFVLSEFRRIRDEIKQRFAEFYITEILKKELPKCSCDGDC